MSKPWIVPTISAVGGIVAGGLTVYATLVKTNIDRDTEMVRMMLQDVLAAEDQDPLMAEWAFKVLEKHTGEPVPRRTDRAEEERPVYRAPEPAAERETRSGRDVFARGELVKAIMRAVRDDATQIAVFQVSTDDDTYVVEWDASGAGGKVLSGRAGRTALGGLLGGDGLGQREQRAEIPSVSEPALVLRDSLRTTASIRKAPETASGLLDRGANAVIVYTLADRQAILFACKASPEVLRSMEAFGPFIPETIKQLTADD